MGSHRRGGSPQSPGPRDQPLGRRCDHAVALPFWGVVIYDIHAYGVRKFWLMAMFVGLYTYLALPLLVEFVKILWPSLGKFLGSRTDGAAAPANKAEPSKAAQSTSDLRL